jgi:hypothetical protein
MSRSRLPQALQRACTVAAHRVAVAAQLQQFGLCTVGAVVPQASHTVPTGLPGTAPPGPGDAGDGHRQLHRRARSAPSAIARATGSLTAPCARISAAGTPSSSVLAALL